MARVQHFEAVLTRPESRIRVQVARPAIEAVGRRVEIQPSGSLDLTVVLLHLPEPYHLDEFLPEIPFLPARAWTLAGHHGVHIGVHIGMRVAG